MYKDYVEITVNKVRKLMIPSSLIEEKDAKIFLSLPMIPTVKDVFKIIEDNNRIKTLERQVRELTLRVEKLGGG